MFARKSVITHLKLQKPGKRVCHGQGNEADEIGHYQDKDGKYARKESAVADWLALCADQPKNAARISVRAPSRAGKMRAGAPSARPAGRSRLAAVQAGWCRGMERNCRCPVQAGCPAFGRRTARSSIFFQGSAGRCIPARCNCRRMRPMPGSLPECRSHRRFLPLAAMMARCPLALARVFQMLQ